MSEAAPKRDREPTDLLCRLVLSTWGVCWGVFLACVVVAAHITITGDTQDQLHPDILQSESMSAFISIPWQERYERMWYALVCVLGGLGGFVSSRFVRPNIPLAALASIAFVPAIAAVCRSVFSANTEPLQFLICSVLLSIPAVARVWRTRSSNCPVANNSEGIAPEAKPEHTSSKIWIIAGLLCLPLTGLLYGLLAPHDLAAAAGEYYDESHVASFLIGPALYYRAPDAVPGLDFESHYGIGHAYTFSRVMGNHGLERTVQRYVTFVMVVTIFYLLTAFLVLTDWLRNPWAALGVTLLLLAAVFEGVSYRYPSNWPVRHPFVFLFLFCAVRGATSASWNVAAGAVAGISLFWQTDIGIYTFAAGFTLYFANVLFLRGSAWRPITFLASGLGSFGAICLVLFGPRVLSVQFCQRLLEPLLLYGTGFGNQLFNWDSSWGLWYNLAGPGLAVASVGAWIGYRRGDTPPRAVLYAAIGSMLGLAMLFKWVNRSIDVVWSLNGGLVVAVVGCWAWLGWRVVSQQLASETRPVLGYCRQAGVAVALLWLAVQGIREDRAAADPKYQGGSSSPLVRIVDRLDTTPNPINARRKGLVAKAPALPLDTNTITFLRAYTHKTERVAVIAPLDWEYLAAAGRAPKLHWVQLFLVHSPVLLDRCVDDIRTSERVFVHCDALISLSKVNPTAYERVSSVLEEGFGPPEWTPCQWVLYHRKPGQMAKR